jgi:hypothetical protein
MKNDDKLLESRIDEDEDLFDLSLDDLEPEDTIVESHIEEPDDEIIELIDLVQKGDIDFSEELQEPGDPLVSEIQEPEGESSDELKVDETLDLLDIPLDEESSFDEFDEERQEAGEVIITGDDLKFFIEGDQSEAIVETPIELFGETSSESFFEESLTDKSEALEEFSEIEGALIVDAAETPAEQHLRESEKTVRIFPVEETTPESLHDMTIEELEQLPGVASEVIQMEQEAALQQLTSEDEEPSPPSATSAGVSEEKIEAIVRKVVEEAVPRIAEEKIAGAVEKIIAGTKKEEIPPAAEPPVGVSEEKIEAILRKVVEEAVPRIAEEKIAGAVEKIIAGTKKEEAPPAAEPTAGVSDEKIEAILRKVVEDVVERVARETMTNIAEKTITHAINALQKSIESASE